MSNKFIQLTHGFIQIIINLLESDLIHRAILCLVISFSALIWLIQESQVSSGNSLSPLLFLVGFINLLFTLSHKKIIKEFAKFISTILVLSLLYSAIIVAVFYILINK